jgi:hypothetical protein
MIDALRQRMEALQGRAERFSNYFIEWAARLVVEHNAIAQPGFLWPFAGTAAPEGWLVADGSDVERRKYSALFKTIGDTYGPGDGSTTFNLPDLTSEPHLWCVKT